MKENGLSSYEEWRDNWQAKRSSEFFILGSKDEIAGNQTCTASLKNGRISLRLRLPVALEAENGKYLIIETLHTLNYINDEDLRKILKETEEK